MVIWECALKGRKSLSLAEVLDRASRWLASDEGNEDLEGVRDVDC
jgi:G:T-mismatch repair DNA endonuclease (very short patch repair protein)